MDANSRQLIIEKICPLIRAGEASLLLGAGFSYQNPSVHSNLPNGDELRDSLLKECGANPGPKTTLKDAYAYAARKIPDFATHLKIYFTVEKVYPWQAKVFEYVWSRIYTTNIDNVLKIGYAKTISVGRHAAEFTFFNYVDAAIIGNSIGTVPVISIHGTVERLEDGFIFSNAEYGKASGRKVLDWHNELAARILVGGLVVIGNQLDESDFDTHLALRVSEYGEATAIGRNWIVIPNPDPIKKENYIAAGYDVIDATAEDFFTVVFETLKPRTIAEVISEDIPAVRRYSRNLKAMMWFKQAFNLISDEIEKARTEAGILRHFITGSHPRWFFIVNSAHAETPKIADLTQRIANLMINPSDRFGILHVVGPSGSGKTTGVRAALKHLAGTFPFLYEYDSDNGIDIDLFDSILKNFTEKAIIVFYSAAAFYYTVNALAARIKDDDRPFILFILEERTNSYRKNRHHLSNCIDVTSEFEFGRATLDDASTIAKKIAEHGIKFDGFSEFAIEKQARIILDSERGFRGDLLSTLFSLTTHENFEKKIYQEYYSVADDGTRSVLDAVAIMGSLGFAVPINYLAGFLDTNAGQITEYVNNDLHDLVIPLKPKMQLMCRHRVIADFYFNSCIARRGSVDLVVGILEFLSRQFSIDDIRYHPLAYEMYKQVISFNFLYDKYFQINSRRADTERTYHEAQRFFGTDGVFWLQFGRFYRKIGELDNAIDCFRTGLTYYDSFQTRHSLGTALLEKYIDTKCINHELYEEGVEILELEQIRRGPLDPYPTATLCRLLLDIMQIDMNNKGVSEKFRTCMNHGMKYFKEDEEFQKTLKKYYALKPTS